MGKSYKKLVPYLRSYQTMPKPFRYNIHIIMNINRYIVMLVYLLDPKTLIYRVYRVTNIILHINNFMALYQIIQNHTLP